jgi:hypothetical protein
MPCDSAVSRCDRAELSLLTLQSASLRHFPHAVQRELLTACRLIISCRHSSRRRSCRRREAIFAVVVATATIAPGRIVGRRDSSYHIDTPHDEDLRAAINRRYLASLRPIFRPLHCISFRSVISRPADLSPLYTMRNITWIIDTHIVALWTY